jgi:GTP-binding protein
MQWYNTSMKKAHIMNASFLCSAAQFEQAPAVNDNEFCLIGRSNVGKSSLINHVFGSRDLARVSKTPGKTTLANFYRLSDNTVWVDLPGYGFASTSKDEKKRWSRLIEEYCDKRGNLKGCIWLLDIRHAALPADCAAYTWLLSSRIPVFPVLTKCDKVSKQEMAARMKEFIKSFGFSGEPMTYSITRPACREEFWMRFKTWQSSLT